MANSQQIAVDRLDKMVGYIQCSLSNYDNNLEPDIEAGSCLEVDGSFFYVTSDESISGWSGISNSTQTYIKATPSGSAGNQSLSFSYTTTAPTWSGAKQGYYETGTSNRIIGIVYKDSSGNYTNKNMLRDRGFQIPMKIETQQGSAGSLSVGDNNVNVTFSFEPEFLLYGTLIETSNTAASSSDFAIKSYSVSGTTVMFVMRNDTGGAISCTYVVTMGRYEVI